MVCSLHLPIIHSFDHRSFCEISRPHRLLGRLIRMSSWHPHCPLQHGKDWMTWSLCQPKNQHLHIFFFFLFTLLLSPSMISSVCVYVSVVVPVCVSVCVQVCVQVCICRCVHRCVCACMWHSEDNLGYHSSGAVCSVFLRPGVHKVS